MANITNFDIHTIVNSEKFRGAITTIASGSVGGLLNIGGIELLGLSPQMSVFLSLYLIGNLVAYTLDILFAKQLFKNASGKKTLISYFDFKFRLFWLLKSFFSVHFFRFIVTIIIDTLIGLSLMSMLLDFLDTKNIQFWMRDTIVAGTVAIFTFILYNNILRFDWAYIDDHNPLLNIIVLMWCTIVMLLFSFHYKKFYSESNEIPQPIRNAWFLYEKEKGEKEENNKSKEINE